MSAPANPQPANPARGEATLVIDGRPVVLRPTFAALVQAEAAIGPLFAFVDRAAEGRASLTDIAALFAHCIVDRPARMTDAVVGEAVIAAGLASVTPVLRTLLTQILQGRAGEPAN